MDKIPNIKLFLTDCDGCLTDGGMYYFESGNEAKRFNTLDGMGIQLLRERGILTGIVTGENTQIVKNRSGKLKMDIVLQGVKDKLSAVEQICKDRGIDLRDVAYVGDDINDLELIRHVGLGCSVNNAIDAVKESAVYVSRKNGGEGAVREIIDWMLEQM